MFRFCRDEYERSKSTILQIILYSNQYRKTDFKVLIYFLREIFFIQSNTIIF